MKYLLTFIALLATVMAVSAIDAHISMQNNIGTYNEHLYVGGGTVVNQYESHIVMGTDTLSASRTISMNGTSNSSIFGSVSSLDLNRNDAYLTTGAYQAGGNMTMRTSYYADPGMYTMKTWSHLHRTYNLNTEELNLTRPTGMLDKMWCYHMDMNMTSVRASNRGHGIIGEEAFVHRRDSVVTFRGMTWNEIMALPYRTLV